jgi:hypothetical protein
VWWTVAGVVVVSLFVVFVGWLTRIGFNFAAYLPQCIKGCH